MVELKDHQQQEMEGKLQFYSHLTLMANLHDQTCEHTFTSESLQLEGSYVEDLQYQLGGKCYYFLIFTLK